MVICDSNLNHFFRIHPRDKSEGIMGMRPIVRVLPEEKFLLRRDHLREQQNLSVKDNT